MEKCVISYNRGGLCNRLKCLISAMRFADKLSRPLILCWPKSYSCYCKFSDLFENKIAEINEDEIKALMTEKDIKERCKIVTTWRLETFPEDGLPNYFSQAKPSGTGANIDCEYNRIPLSVRNNFLVYINRLIPVKCIRLEFEKFSKNFADNTVSIHIRSYKKESGMDRAIAPSFNIKNVFRIMDKMNKHNFFVACDSPEVFEKLIHRYGKRILSYTKKLSMGNRKSIEGIKDAMIDLFLLSKNKIIIASWWSTFSEMAWWFGNCKAKVEVIPPGNLLFHPQYFNFQKTRLQAFMRKKIPHLYDLYLGLKKLTGIKKQSL